MQTRTLGNQQVGAIGLGLMTFDQTGTQPRQQLLDTVTAALDAGVTLFDTADAYGPGDEKGAGAQGANERLIASILDELGVRDRVVLATKGGHVRTEGGGWEVDSSAAHLRAAVDASLERLGVEQIVALAAPPARPEGLLRRRDRHPQGDRRQRQGRPRRALQRRPRPDPRRARGARRRAGQRAEPVQPQVPLQQARDRRVRRARAGVPAVEPAGRAGPTPRSWPTSTPPSPRSRPTAASAPSRSPWPGSSPSRRSSSRSRAPSGPPRSPTPRPPRRSS